MSQQETTFDAIASITQSLYDGVQKQKEAERQRIYEQKQAERAARRASSRGSFVAQVEETLKTMKLEEGVHASFQTEDANVFRDIFKAACLVSEEPVFTLDKDGLHFRAMDPSHVSLLQLDYPADQFFHYEYNGPEKGVQFALSSEELTGKSKGRGYEAIKVSKEGLLRRIDKADKVTFIADGGREEATIILENGSVKTFTLKFYEYSPGETPLPKLEFDSFFTTSKETFMKMLKDVSVVADQIVFNAISDREFEVSGKSDVGRALLEPSIEMDLLEYVVKQKSRAAYNVDYLRAFVGTISISDALKFEWTSKKPCRVTMPVTLGEWSKACFTYWLAPRLSDPDEPPKEPDEGPKPEPAPATPTEPEQPVPPEVQEYDEKVQQAASVEDAKAIEPPQPPSEKKQRKDKKGTA